MRETRDYARKIDANRFALSLLWRIVHFPIIARFRHCLIRGDLSRFVIARFAYEPCKFVEFSWQSIFFIVFKYIVV